MSITGLVTRPIRSGKRWSDWPRCFGSNLEERACGRNRWPELHVKWAASITLEPHTTHEYRSRFIYSIWSINGDRISRSGSRYLFEIQRQDFTETARAVVRRSAQPVQCFSGESRQTRQHKFQNGPCVRRFPDCKGHTTDHSRLPPARRTFILSVTIRSQRQLTFPRCGPPL